MSILKSQIKIGTVSELGAQLDDLLEKAEKEPLKCEGYSLCLKEFETGLTSIFSRVDTERDEGQFDAFGNPLEVAGLVKKFLTRVHASIEGLKAHNEKVRLVQEGRVLGLRQAVEIAKKMHDSEQLKMAALAKAVEEGVITVEEDPKKRPVGKHPGPSLKSRRTAKTVKSSQKA